MRITESHLRRIIRQELISEVSAERVPVSSSKDYIGPNVTISLEATVAGSEVGDRNQPNNGDATTIQGESNVANSSVYSSSSIIRSDVVDCSIRQSSIEKSKISKAMISSSKITSSTLTSDGSRGDIAIHNTTFENSSAKDFCDILDSTVKGAAKIKRSKLRDSTVVGTDIDNSSLYEAKTLGGTIADSTIAKAKVEYAQVYNGRILDDGTSVVGKKGGDLYIERAHISGGAQIAGEPHIIGVTEGSTMQPAIIQGPVRISGNPKISGRVMGNAQVSGNAEIHGLAVIKGTCIVTGTARMISGEFTRGTFTEGDHEGGDSTLSKIATSIGL